MAKATLDLETQKSQLEAAIESNWFRNLVTGLIILNAIVLGCGHNRRQRSEQFLTLS